MLLTTSPRTTLPQHSTGWRLLRRAADWAFRYTIPGRYNSLDGSLLALMTVRETRP